MSAARIASFTAEPGATAAPRIVVTGATGFVGTWFVRAVVEAGGRVVAISTDKRRAAGWHAGLAPEIQQRVEVLASQDAWHERPAVRGADALVHLAARVHVMRDTADDPDAAFHAANVDGTTRVLRRASLAGVARVVFVSTVKVLGDVSPDGGLTERSPLQPGDAYSRSKVVAERAVAEHAASTGLATVVVRPPLVYGPGVGGNMASLMRWIAQGRPVPLGGVGVRRSMIGVRNLASVLLACARDPRAVGETFLVADDLAPTMRELVTAFADALGRAPRAFTVPAMLQRTAAQVPALHTRLQRLSTPLVVDDRHVRRTLDWAPRWTLRDELAAMVDSQRRLASAA